jgi:hypothetical protein
MAAQKMGTDTAAHVLMVFLALFAPSLVPVCYLHSTCESSLDGVFPMLDDALTKVLLAVGALLVHPEQMDIFATLAVRGIANHSILIVYQ